MNRNIQNMFTWSTIHVNPNDIIGGDFHYGLIICARKLFDAKYQYVNTLDIIENYDQTTQWGDLYFNTKDSDSDTQTTLVTNKDQLHQHVKAQGHSSLTVTTNNFWGVTWEVDLKSDFCLIFVS